METRSGLKPLIDPAFLRKIYVFGLFQTSPGKTTVSTALCRGLLKRGCKVSPFKPRSGHNLWFQRGSFNKCKVEARLYCEDIIRLKEAARCYLPYEILNPVDALMAPLDARTFLNKNYMREMYIKDENTFNHLLVERYTSWREGMARSTVCVNDKNRLGDALTDRDYIRQLMEKSDEVLKIKDEAGWNSVFITLAPRSISTCGRRIAEEYEVMVVEGFNDAVCPAPELRYEAVLGVGPGAAALYNPDDFERAIKVKSMIGSEPMDLRSRDIVNFIKPKKIMTVPALDKKDINDFDRLSKKLGELVDDVLREIEHSCNRM